MLYSKEKCTEKSERPHFSLWFGNFFEPYYSDKDLVDTGMKEIADMGFNSIILDSKLWEDFTEFFETGKESEYVAMQRYMIEKCTENGMGINFLTLFYNGDNLYPHIRDSKPDIISPVIDRNGNVFRGYKHWDRKQTEALVKHTVNLYRKLACDAAAKAVDENGNNRIPCYFYHSPALMPSFDDDGKSVYTAWLKNKYKDIDCLNKEYGIELKTFEESDMKALWPEMKESDYADKNRARLIMHRDNMLFRQDLLDSFYKELTAGVRKELPDIYLYDCLSQWKYYLTDWVDISERGLDLWRLGKYLDSPSFYTLPADAYGEPDCYAVSLENAFIRSAADNNDIVSGLFLGRYLYNDIYEYVSPEEAIASCYGAGATDMFFYGYSGLDDGGNFAKWDKNRKKSVKSGLDWFAEVRKISGKRVRDYTAAIIFPYASHTMDIRKFNDKSYRASRNDILGYYRQLADLGINADIVDRTQASSELINKYKLIVLPSDLWYSFLPDANLEKVLSDYVENGGTVIVGATSRMFNVFGIKTHYHKEDSIAFEEEITEFSQEYIAFDNIECEAYYCADEDIAIGKKHIGKGTVYALGIDLGTCYCEKRQKPVPVAYGKNAQYPITMISRTPIEKWIIEMGIADKSERGIEKVRFENGELIINHTVYDYEIRDAYKNVISSDGTDSNIIHGHRAAFIKK